MKVILVEEVWQDSKKKDASPLFIRVYASFVLCLFGFDTTKVLIFVFLVRLG